MKNLWHKSGSCLGIALVMSLLWGGAANAAWEPAKNVDNQSTEGTTAGDVGWYVGLADGGNGVSTAFFDQTVATKGYYGIRRGPSDSTWGAPSPIGFPGGANFTNQPLVAAADSNGNAVSATSQTAPAGVFTVSWPASAGGPGAYRLLMSGSLTDPAVAFDGSGHGYAVAGEGQGASTNAPILISTYSTSSDSWSNPTPITVAYPASSNCANGPSTSPPTGEICGQEPRLAVSPDGTVVVVYLKASPSPVPGGPVSYNVYAVRAAAGGVAGSGGGAFVAEHKISANAVQTTSNPGASPSTTPPNFDVAIDGADITTIVDAESQSGINNSIFATRWQPGGVDPSGEVQISTTSQPAPPASEPRVVASPGGDVTAMWTESSPNPASDSLLSAELAGDSAKSWLGPTTVSSSVDNPGGPGGYSVNTPPFWLAEDGAGNAYAVWTNNNQVMGSSLLQDSIRQPGKSWSTVDTISGVPAAISGTERVATGLTGQADAVVVGSNGSRNALYATRFTSPLPPASTTTPPPPGPSPTPPNNPSPAPEVPCNARPALRIAVGRTHATKTSISVAGTASERVCQHASTAQHAQNHLVQVFVTIYHPAPLGKCQFLKRNGKLTATVPCSQAVTFVARGTNNWSLRLNVKVPSVPGGFLVRAWAVDGFGRQSVRGPSSVTHLKLPKKPKKPKHHG